MLLRRHKTNYTPVATVEVAPVVKETEKPAEVKEEKPEYTVTSINRMAKADLQKLASEIGIEGADDKSGNALKSEIIEKLGL